MNLVAWPQCSAARLTRQNAPASYGAHSRFRQWHVDEPTASNDPRPRRKVRPMPVSVGDLSRICQLEGRPLAAIAAEIFLTKSNLPLLLIAS